MCAPPPAKAPSSASTCPRRRRTRPAAWGRRAALLACAAAALGAHGATLNLESTISRPLRYRPEGGDFVIENGAEYFNRPLYTNTAFRVDGGDRPEFSLFLPGRGGVLRLGVVAGGRGVWLDQAADIVSRYRPGSLLYEISDPLLGEGRLRIAALLPAAGQGLVLRVSYGGAPVRLVWAFGGSNGERGRRDGDIGTESEPVSRFFQLRPEYCRGNAVALRPHGFELSSPAALVRGLASPGAEFGAGDAGQWDASPERLLSALAHAGAQAPALPVAVGARAIGGRQPECMIALQRVPRAGDDRRELSTYLAVRAERGPAGAPATVAAPDLRPADLPALFAAAQARRKAIAEKIAVETPDPFVDAAAAALCVAADGVWDEATGTVQHGAVAWRSRLLGWRGPYANDEFGWHDRALRHFSYWAARQNTSPAPRRLPPPDASANLSRNEAALHSNGDISNSHYDMNLVYIDEVFRHLLWTGDLAFARRMWPVIERHLAWERRLFRRTFGPDHLPLYEGYCCIWASDDLEYEGGGAAHASAYNYYENVMAARLARRLGADPAPYEREARLIWKGMHQELWLPERGWFGEWKDLLGRQMVHESPALWTFYHTLDSAAATPREAWQMSRFIDTQIAHIPLRGPGMPEDGSYVLPTTNWMPYTWSTNNVVMAEVMHTALGYWQAGRADEAYRMFKGALLASMYAGLCPGNAGMTTTFDMARGESQRDFADGIGTSSRALVEGLFGVAPDALAGELRIRPGFPSAWDRARLRHPDFDFSYERQGLADRYRVAARFPRPMRLELELAARRDRVRSVTLNGAPVAWRPVEEAVGQPRIAIDADAAADFEIAVTWAGAAPAPPVGPARVARGGEFRLAAGGAVVTAVADPQHALGGQWTGEQAPLPVTGLSGQRTIFAFCRQGEMHWWAPVAFEVTAERAQPAAAEPAPAAPRYDTVDLAGLFNDRVTQIYRHDYLSPRSPYCSLAMPKQGIGTWCRPTAGAVIDDSGLRRAADAGHGRIALPSGVVFAVPGTGGAPNIAFVSQWDNFPREETVRLRGRAHGLHLLMAGSTNSMQSRCDNGEVVVAYADGSTQRLPLVNPVNWWPVEEDYWIDDFAFRRPEPIPVRIDLRDGRVRAPNPVSFAGQGRTVPGGAATALEIRLDPRKELRSFTVRALANEVVIGLMAATVER
ncbi:MAG TPA: DUF4450 domain-containing protein [Opitutaceae bacterium]|nr:DUF4450 domain-containing protein [Opitutaceae bacterium]